MKKLVVMLTVAFFATITGLRAQTDTSYLLIQGPFGTNGATETFDWQVNYQAGTLVTGQDLLTAVLGSPSLTGNYSDSWGDTYNYWTSGNSATGAGYVDFSGDGLGLFLTSVTLNSTTVNQDPSWDPAWNYYAAEPTDGAWSFSEVGMQDRDLTNGSFDAWVFGANGDNGESVATIDNGTVGGTNDDQSASSGVNAPLTANFAGATVITVVPEPGSVALLLCGAGGMMMLYKKRRA